jgi:hypothetical protein
VFTGTGSPGDTVFITVNGSVLPNAAVVQADGTFSLSATTTIPQGATVVASSGSPSGPASGTLNAGAPLPTPAPTTTAGVVPVAGGATFVTTNAPPGALVEVIDLSLGGEVLGSGTAPSSGSLAVPLNAPVGVNQQVELVVDGVAMTTLTSTAAMGGPPVVVDGTVLTSGSVVTAQGTPGAILQVLGPQGQILGTAQVNAQGAASIPVNGAGAGWTLTLAQNGVGVKLSQPALALGSAQVFLSTNIFNPLKGSPLAIGFKAPADERVTIKVFDLAGELVRAVDTLDAVNGQLYSETWDGRNHDGETVSSGIFIVSVYGPHTHILKKVVVLK